MRCRSASASKDCAPEHSWDFCDCGLVHAVTIFGQAALRRSAVVAAGRCIARRNVGKHFETRTSDYGIEIIVNSLVAPTPHARWSFVELSSGVKSGESNANVVVATRKQTME